MINFGSAVILAGGKSTRMGFNKKNLKINNERLLKVLEKTLRKEFSEIILVSNTVTTLDIFDKVSKDMIESVGPLSGIYTGLSLSSSKYVYFIACDMPVVNLDYIRFMKSSILHSDKNTSACVTKYKQWIEPFNAFYSRDIRGDIVRSIERKDKSIYHLLKNLNTLYINENIAKNYSENMDMFHNLNTKEDIQNYINKTNNK